MTTTEAIADTYATRLGSTLPEVRDRIERACASVGRDPAGVRLVAVTKSHPIEAVDAALAAGLTDLGENRIEELERKVQERGREGITWHMVGHVQSRKAPRVAEAAGLIHSVGSDRLAERLARVGTERGRDVRVLVQVNTSGEEAKGGLDPVAAVEQIQRWAEMPGLRVEGLMAMAPFVQDEAILSAAFSDLRDILERARRVSELVGPELSMGMTNDLETAIREGSTMVRIGTALFGERPGSPR